MKNERGSITLFVLVSMLFFLIIATTAYVSASSKLQGQNDEIARIKASYEQDLSDEALLQLYNKVTKTREWLAGSGTQEDTYKIYTIEDLVTFSIRSNNGDFIDEETSEAKYIYVELMNDLDFNRDSSYAKATRTDFGDVNEDGTIQDLKTELTTGQGFPCIAATDTNVFEGNFEGNDHEIRNLWINVSDNTATSVGLFGWVGDSTLENFGTTGSVTSTGIMPIGGIIGKSISNGTCTIKSCYNKSNVTGLRFVGGIIGYCDGIINIKNSYNVGDIISTADNITITYSIGGIMGYASNNSQTTIEDCYNTGNITSQITYASSTICNGGITGRMTNGVIKNCYNIGKITEGNRTGGILGIADGSSNNVVNTKIINSYNTGNIDATSLNNQNTSNSSWYGRSGGIACYGWYSNLDIINCYNTGDIKSYYRSGGIESILQYGSINVINCYNFGNITATDYIAAIINIINPDRVTINNLSNIYYKDNITTGVEGITPDPATQMTESQMKDLSFVTTLNSNKNSINLSDYGLSEYTLSSWKQGEDGYPVFDW